MAAVTNARAGVMACAVLSIMLATWMVPILFLVLGIRGSRVVLVITVVTTGGAVDVMISGGLLLISRWSRQDIEN